MLVLEVAPAAVMSSTVADVYPGKMPRLNVVDGLLAIVSLPVVVLVLFGGSHLSKFKIAIRDKVPDSYAA